MSRWPIRSSPSGTRASRSVSSVEIVDLNSANGIVVDGGRVQRLRVIPGQRFTLGDTDLVVRMVEDFAPLEAEPVLERGGSLLFNRSPRVEPRYVGEQLPEPRMPKDPITRLFPWPMLVAPIILGLSIFAISGQLRSLLVIALSPLMLLGNFISQKTQVGQRLRKEAEVFERQFEELEEMLYRERPRERGVRNAEVAPVAVVFEEAMRLGPMLWTQTAGALELPRRAPGHHGRAIADDDQEHGLHRGAARVRRARRPAARAISARSTACRSSSPCRASA